MFLTLLKDSRSSHIFVCLSCHHCFSGLISVSLCGSIFRVASFRGSRAQYHFSPHVGYSYLLRAYSGFQVIKTGLAPCLVPIFVQS